jgi:solute carrier family 25 iron transporter 28/37
MDIEEEATKSTINFISGAIAGTAEHCGMYPIDTIKTHLQANKKSKIIRTTVNIWRANGIGGFFRGITAVFWGAAPAHAVYFSVYEILKKELKVLKLQESLLFSMAGVIATLLSDAVLCPMDAIKQRRQLNVKQYSGTMHCARTVIKNEGIKALYAGYTTTVSMNIPYGAIYFPMYEMSKKFFNKLFKNENEDNHVAYVHTLAGGFAGVIASGITNPLDVAKTRLQTQGDLGVSYKGMMDAMYKIWIEEGAVGFMRGIGPRMMFNSMSAGICWTVYEYLKYFLSNNTNL